MKVILDMWRRVSSQLGSRTLQSYRVTAYFHSLEAVHCNHTKCTRGAWPARMLVSIERIFWNKYAHYARASHIYFLPVNFTSFNRSGTHGAFSLLDEASSVNPERIGRVHSCALYPQAYLPVLNRSEVTKMCCSLRHRLVTFWIPARNIWRWYIIIS